MFNSFECDHVYSVSIVLYTFSKYINFIVKPEELQIVQTNYSHR